MAQKHDKIKEVEESNRLNATRLYNTTLNQLSTNNRIEKGFSGMRNFLSHYKYKNLNNNFVHAQEISVH